MSLLAVLFARVGLILVVAGVVWSVAERSRRAGPRARHALGVAAIVVVALVSLIMSAGAFAASFVAGAGVIVGCLVAIVRLTRRTRDLRAEPPPRTSIGASLIAVPVLALAAQLVLDDLLTRTARDRVIANAAPLIAVIERHRAERGKYPPSFAALHGDINPGVIGVDRFRYDPAGDSYNLYFELPSFRLGTQEIVMYNPRDQHAMTSHLLDLLELSPENLRLDQSRGHYALHTARQPHWKYYWFD